VVVPQNGFNENKQPALTAEDIRFTTTGKVLYAFVMGTPSNDVVIKALGTSSPQQPGKILNVEMLGHQDKLHWKQEKQALQVRVPSANMSDIGVTLKVTLA